MIADPPVRRDGKCARSGCSRSKPGPSRYAGDAILRDPFCSTECARRWHGCELVHGRAPRPPCVTVAALHRGRGGADGAAAGCRTEGSRCDEAGACVTRKCWIYSCWRAAVGESRFCAVHGWNHKGKDHVPPPEKPVKK